MTLQMSHTSPLRLGLMAAGALAAFAAPAFAQEATEAAAAPEFASAAETAFIFNTLLFLMGGFLVMWMAAGFAMLEAGLVRSKNVSMQCLKNIALYSIAGLMFWVIGYSLMYTDVNGGYFGTPVPYSWPDAGTANEGDYSVASDWFFQMVFCATTASIVSGTLAERIKLWPFLIFTAILTGVLYPITGSWQWGAGWLSEAGFSDFAGSTLVHSVGGWAALAGAILLGARKGKYGADGKVTPMPGSNMALATLGTFILWFGWFGFNGGSALAANGAAGMALTVTHIAAATASLVWMLIEWKKYGKPSLVGLVTGTIAGLATITPASGFVGPIGALIIGVAAGLVCFKMVQIVKTAWKLDDSLDVFAVHGVGGSLGTILVAFLCAPMFGGLGLPEGKTMMDALGVQALGLAATVAWSAIATFILVKITAGLTNGIRVREDDELEGLDITNHGETAYRLD